MRFPGNTLMKALRPPSFNSPLPMVDAIRGKEGTGAGIVPKPLRNMEQNLALSIGKPGTAFGMLETEKEKKEKKELLGG